MYRVARKRQFCEMGIPFLCQNSTLIVNLTFDNIRLLIEERITMPSNFCCCLDQVSYHGFNKKVVGQIFSGFVLLMWACTLLLEKLYLDAYSPHVYTVYGIEICLRLVQLNLVSLSTKENYKESKELLLAFVLECKLYCSQWIES